MKIDEFKEILYNTMVKYTEKSMRKEDSYFDGFPFEEYIEDEIKNSNPKNIKDVINLLIVQSYHEAEE